MLEYLDQINLSIVIFLEVRLSNPWVKMKSVLVYLQVIPCNSIYNLLVEKA
jgi:hypothetical protein